MKLPYPRTGEPIKAEHIRQLADAIRSVGIVPSPRVRPLRTAFGTALDITAGGSASASVVLPLNCRLTNANTTNNTADILVEPGTVLGVMPTIGAVNLDADDPPELQIPLTGTRYVVLNISGTPDTTTLDGRVFFHPVMDGIEVTITAETTEPTPDDILSDIGSFKVLLATFVDGERTVQNGYGPITGYVQDLLDGSGDGVLMLTYASATA